MKNNEITGKRFVDGSWEERWQIGQRVAEIPTILCMWLIRTAGGYRSIKPVWFVVQAIIMCILPVAVPKAVKPCGSVMVVYGLVSLGMALLRRHRAWKSLCQGIRRFTFSPGFSWIERIPRLHSYFLRERRVQRFLDPLAILIIGIPFGLLCHLMGLWFLISAACLAVWESDLYRRMIDRDLNILDSFFTSEVQADVAKMFEEGASQEKLDQVVKDAGDVSTGMAPDIQRQIQIRKAKARKSAPDNLATQQVARI